MNNPTGNDSSTMPPGTDGTRAELPKPIIKKMRWPFPIIWIVPLVAAIVAGYFLYQHHQENGVDITLEFPDSSGITPDQTMLLVHGVPVGKVRKIELSDDHSHAMVIVRVGAENQFIAHDETIFWLVRPEVWLESITGLNALVSGPYIEARPGNGRERTHFIGLTEVPKTNGPGMRIVLHGDNLGSVTAQSPVVYLGIQVGLVQEVRLSDDGDTADITIFIQERFAPLVRENSVFWAVKAADLKGGLFSGVKLKLDSLKSILTGGISFATPDKHVGPPAPDGAQFFLHEQPADEWQKWRPRIRLSPATPISTTAPGTDTGPLPIPAPKEQKVKAK